MLTHKEVNVLTVNQAAKRLGVTKQRVHQLLKAGALQGEFVGPPGHGFWQVTEASVEDRNKEKK